jgi:hypothetical protein
VLVTGGTGLIGRALVRDLLASGVQVRVVTRDPARAKKVFMDLCEYVSWDIEKRELESSAMEGVDAVVHLAGEPVAKRRWTPRRKAAIYRSRVTGAEILGDAMASMRVEDRPKVLVSASAVGFYGELGNFRVDETFGPGHGFLSAVCAGWEAASLEVSNLGVRACAMRIGMVLSTDGGALPRMARVFRRGLGGHMGSGRQWLAWIHIVDLIALVRLAIEDPSIEGPINAVAPRPVTNFEFATELAHTLNAGTFLGAPGFLLRLLIGEQSELFLTSIRAVPNLAAYHRFAFSFPELRAALTSLLAVH